MYDKSKTVFVFMQEKQHTLIHYLLKDKLTKIHNKKYNHHVIKYIV